MILSIQTKTGSGLNVLLLAAHGLLGLEPNMMAVSGYNFFYVNKLFFDIISDILFFNMQIRINQRDHNCASTQRVVSKMANIGWVAERAIPLLKRDP